MYAYLLEMKILGYLEVCAHILRQRWVQVVSYRQETVLIVDKVCESKQYSQLSGEIFHKASQLFHILIFNISIVCFLPCYLPMNKLFPWKKISDRLWVQYREQYQSLLTIWTESRSTDEMFLYIFVPQSFFPAIIQLLGVFAWILNTTKTQFPIAHGMLVRLFHQ